MTKVKSFEEQLSRLEDIVSLLESGDKSLDESLKLFKEGVELVNICNKKLGEAEQSLKMILNENGEIKEKDFKEDGED